MTIADRIISFLKKRPDGVDDDELARTLNLTARQQANSRCRALEKEGVVERRKVNGKIHNFWTGMEIPWCAPSQADPKKDNHELWFWEGNVQAQIVKHLAEQGYQIQSVADTASRERGKDIVARRDGKELWVSVKGYPKGTPRTNPSLQAGHWFKQAIFDILLYRGEDPSLLLAVGLPDYPRYRALAAKIDWFEPVANFIYIWVQEDGTVSSE